MAANSYSSKTKHFYKLTILLFGFWVFLSGKLDAFHLSIGLVSAIAIAWMTLPIMKIPAFEGKTDYYAFDIRIVRFIRYWVWLLKEIVLANIELVMIILHPKMPIEPQVVTLRKKFLNPIAQTVLTNSIILTPGTLTIDVDKDVYQIHALTKKAAEKVLERDEKGLLGRINHVFNEYENR